jgi:tRNA(Ile)-lysidine synthase
MLIEKVKKTIRKFGLLKKGDTVIVGVSGGADSLTLLYVLDFLKKEFSLKLHVAHIDHMMRRDSALDRKFVERISEKLGISVTCEKIDIKKISQTGSLEEIARNARLSFFFNLSRRIKADKIALGHNLDDQAETVLMRLLRGAGLYGLSGILPKRNIGGFTIVRPLLGIKRKEIENFLKRKKISPRVDSTNFQEIYLRNKIRNKLMPVLAKNYNPNIKEILSNTAASIAVDYDFLTEASIKAAKNIGVNFDLKRFSLLHRAVQRMVLRIKISRLKGDMRKINFKHIQEIEDLILTRPVNSLVDLPGNIRIRKGKRSLIFCRRKS